MDEKAPTARAHTFVAENGPGNITGLLYGGPERTGRNDFRAEIYAVYVLKRFRCQGLGRGLFQQFARAMVAEKMTSAIVWALEPNSDRAAYAAWGGQEIERAPIQIGTEHLVEVAYGWRDLRAVADLSNDD